MPDNLYDKTLVEVCNVVAYYGTMRMQGTE